MHTKYNLSETVKYTIETLDKNDKVVTTNTSVSIQGIRTTAIMDDAGNIYEDVEYLISYAKDEMEWVYEDILLEMNRNIGE
ncbi:hypothetical protein VP496E541_P0113 [Vibrio phage 496E54-1]|nr:hypothetical protein VP495E541_P0114 [Vibrio phage 495E54-1]CAH9013659.1 hypothetical protein VP496E541_P0113 [Vibrio phage 496E54-1]